MQKLNPGEVFGLVRNMTDALLTLDLGNGRSRTWVVPVKRVMRGADSIHLDMSPPNDWDFRDGSRNLEFVFVSDEANYTVWGRGLASSVPLKEFEIAEGKARVAGNDATSGSIALSVRIDAARYRSLKAGVRASERKDSQDRVAQPAFEMAWAS